MRARVATGVALLLTIVAATGLRSQQASPASPAKAEGTWLTGTVDERLTVVARHLRGLDVAMIEVGYRYGELYWSGQDRNWEFATYQIGKIRTSMRNAIQRRPARGASAQVLEGALPAVEEAVRAKDPVRFASAFNLLTESCNACHKAEQVPFMYVSPPSIRQSVISGPAAPGRDR